MIKQVLESVKPWQVSAFTSWKKIWMVLSEGCVLYFLPGDHLFKGFHGLAERSNESFAELDDHHHLGHVDAAFRMHYEDSPSEHDHMFFFLVRSSLWLYWPFFPLRLE